MMKLPENTRLRNSRQRHGRRVAWLFCCLVCQQLVNAQPSTYAQPTYTVIDLGPDAIPNDLNQNGEVVGTLTVAPFTTTGFYFEVASGITELPGTSQASAINDVADIVGQASDGGAFLISGGSFLEFAEEYTASGLNNLGQVAGSRSKPNPFRPTPLPTDVAIYDALSAEWWSLDIAQVYPRGTRDGVYADLYRLHDVNDLGFAVGVKSRSGLYGSSSIMTTPGSDAVTFLPVLGGGEAYAINNLNQVVGRNGESNYTAYLYDVDNDSTTLLGTLVDATYSVAYDVNDNGQVVGTSSGRGFIWHDGQMTDLNSQLEPSSGWVVTSAEAINEQGDIAAIGTLNGETHGMLLLVDGDGGGNQSPVSIIATNRTRGRAPLRIRFDGSGSSDPDGTITGYAWDFGDAASSDQRKVTHIYRTPGIYTATLTVTDDGGLSSSASVVIKVR